MDLRTSAEVLLRYHDALVLRRRAKRLPQPARRVRTPFDSRLKPRGGLDTILTEYGLSPHPRLILVVEGDTELLLFPRVMRFFDIRIDDDFISIQNREGVAKDVAALVSYAVAPRTEPEEDGRYLRPRRPVTSMLVISDAEGPMATTTQRKERRKALVDRALRTLPVEHRTPEVRDAVESLVDVDVWHRRGLSPEFAHFTDRQIATAIWNLDTAGKHTSFAALVGHVRNMRARRGNLDALLGRTSKVDLADELWPVLERKIRRAEKRRTEAKIPIVRVLDRALEFAHEHPRRGVVIPLERVTRRQRAQA